MYRLYYLKGVDGPIQVYRCIVGKAEKKTPASYIIWSAVHVKDPAEMKVWVEERGCLVANTAATALQVRPSYMIFGGHYDNQENYR